jgi:drug/metabolite transporter (DMT)-like permease
VAIALAVLAAVSFGGADFLGGLATKRAESPSGVVAGVAVFGLVPLLALAPITDGGSVPGGDLLWGGAAGVVGGLGVLVFYGALATGVMSVVAPATAITSALVPVAAGLALGEDPGRVPLAGVGVAVIAIALLSRGGPTGTSAKEVMDTGLLAKAVVAGLCFGTFYILLDRTHDSAGLWPLVATRAATIATMVIVGLALRQRLRLPSSARPAVLLGGILDAAANALFLAANRTGLLSLVAVIVSLYPASTIALAYTVLGERLQRRQMVGIVMAAIAVALIVGG